MMLGKVAAFEFRYQLKSPLAAAVAALLFLASFFNVAGIRLIGSAGGNVLSNAPHSIILAHMLASLSFLFVGAAFVSNVIVRDDQTGFGPIIRSTRITKADYLFGRFIGAFGVSALLLGAVTLGTWLGTLMPFADPHLLGPNRVSGFAYGYLLFALPTAFIMASVLFALATWTRSTAGTFIGVVAFLVVYLLAQRIMEGQVHPLNVRVLADPLGLSAYMASSRYFTAAELNAGAVPVTGLMIVSRIGWMAIASLLLVLTYARFGFAQRKLSRRKERKLARQREREAALVIEAPAAAASRLPEPRFDARSARVQFFARARMEAAFILKSPTFLILLLIAFAFTLPILLTAAGFMDVPVYPLTSITVPFIQQSFAILLIVIAAFYGGELVWRDRERHIAQIIDATPLPSWALMLPKMVGLAFVLVATLAIGMVVGILVQLLVGGVPVAIGEYLAWYLLPGAVDATLVAVLAIFVQALSPSKYAGWGIMFAYIFLLIFGPSLGLEYPLLVYGGLPAVSLSDMAGTGNSGAAGWWFRLVWAALAVLMLAAVQALWPRGTENRLRQRLANAPRQFTGSTRRVAALAGLLLLLSGGWVAYNTLVLNPFQSSFDGQRYLAEYEKRYFKYAALPQPAVSHVSLNVALYPEQRRAEVSGRYTIVNDTSAPIGQLHLRLMNEGLEFVSVDVPGARLAHDDAEFGYRIYRFDRPMQPGETREIAFRTRRDVRGFRASDPETGLQANGTDLNSFELTPRIGMSDVGLIDDPATRREFGLPQRPPLPRLNDMAAMRAVPSGDDAGWTTSDIIVSTTADQTPVAPGTKVAEQVANGRRTVRFVSTVPIKNFFAIQSARYAIKKQTAGGIDYVVYYDPRHAWNVDRTLAAMKASIGYYQQAFGSYQFKQVRIVETPSFRRDGGQAFPGTLLVSETGSFGSDVRGSGTFDMVTMLTAHELAHQYWGHQVLGARMQGGAMLYETLAQYSALMVLKHAHGEAQIRQALQFQLDRYLAGRRTEAVAEQPLAAVEISQKHIAYGKGALVMFLLQHRMGEEAVNRALHRFVTRYRFAGAPYPRSLDLIAYLRAEAKTPEDQALITDLFERITLYDLKVGQVRAVKRADGKWDVTVPVVARKMYANGSGVEKEAPLNEPIEIGLFAADPSSAGFSARQVIPMEPQRVHSGGQLFRFVTDRKPAYAGIDPYNYLIDRNAQDNVAAVN